MSDRLSIPRPNVPQDPRPWTPRKKAEREQHRFVRLIKKEMQLSGDSMRGFADELGIGESTLRKWLTGQRHPHITQLERALKALGYNLTLTPVGEDDVQDA